DDIVISILESDNKRQPTIEVRDRGIGLTPSLVPKTILNLGGGNKVDKMYLAGAYGQGGSTALAFSPDGCLFVVRRQLDLLPPEEGDLIGVTFARFNPLDPRKHKNGQYEYLVTKDRNVAGISPDLLKDFDPGVCVVHFNLNIHHYSARI